MTDNAPASFMNDALNALTAAAKEPNYYSARDAYNHVCTYVDSVPWNKHRHIMNDKINPILTDLDNILYDQGQEGQKTRAKYGMILTGNGDKVLLTNLQTIINELRKVINLTIFLEQEEKRHKEPWWI